MTETLSGGCQCGRIRFRVSLDAREGYLCHCRMCQRATGGVAAAFVAAPLERIAWEVEPDWHASSPIARRAFCAACGTPLGFRFNDGTQHDLMLGTLDDPAGFVPTGHYGAESLHEAWLDTSALPRHVSAETESVVKRWQAAGREVPE